MKNAFVTGASTGIGRAICESLAATERWIVFAGVRNFEKLVPFKHPNIKLVQLDLANLSDPRALLEQMPEELHAIVNNAGINLLGPLEYTNIQKAREQFEVNFWGPVAISQLLLPRLRAAHRPHWNPKVVVIGSIGSLAAVPWQPFYHATKFALLGVFESTKYELASQEVKVTVICPGGVRTDFMAKTGQSARQALSELPPHSPKAYQHGIEKLSGIIATANRAGSTPEAVARKVVRVIESRDPKFQIIVGSDAKLIWLLKCWLPERAFMSIYQRIFT